MAPCAGSFPNQIKTFRRTWKWLISCWCFWCDTRFWKTWNSPDVLYAFYFLIRFLSTEWICLDMGTVKPVELQPEQTVCIRLDGCCNQQICPPVSLTHFRLPCSSHESRLPMPYFTWNAVTRYLVINLYFPTDVYFFTATLNR